MPIEQQMRQPEMAEVTNKTPLQIQLETYFGNFHDRILNGQPHHERTEKDIKAEQALAYAYDVLVRNNQMCDLLRSEEYDPIRNGEKELKGQTEVGEFFCLDGRILRVLESFSINTWENAAGLIGAEKRESDGKLIPSSSNLCESIKGKIDPNNPEVDILEINKAHYDSTSPTHGCAAINLIRRALTREEADYEKATDKEEQKTIEEDLVTKQDLKEVLSSQDIKEILEAPTPEEANVIILEKINVPALSNYINTVREQANLPILERASITALYDTATMGFEMRYNSQRISTTDLTNKYKGRITQFAQTIDTEFGKYNKIFENPSLFMEFSNKLLTLETEIINNPEGRFDEINNDVNNYLKDNLNDLTTGQKQALRFKMLRRVSLQYLLGVSQLVDGKPNHPHAHHREAYSALGVGGKFVGKYDLIEQQFGSSPADIETAINEMIIGNLVMDTNHLKENETRVAFICSSDNTDPESKTSGLKSARIVNAELIRGVGKNDKLKMLIKNGVIIPIPVILNKDRKALEIPDHSAYF
jgi:hypothetical protein